MAFTLPTFNLTVNIWHYATWFGNFPGTIPVPDLTSTANLTMSRRGRDGFLLPMWLLLPAGTDIRDEVHEAFQPSHGDIVEVPAGSGRYYGVLEMDDSGKGFANEHRVCSLTLGTPFITVLPAWPGYPYP